MCQGIRTKPMKKIRIVSPAKVIDKELVDYAVDFLQKNNFEVEVSKNALGKNNYFSGTDAERLADFQEALDDETLDFILCTRGGYGSVRIIDELDFSKFLQHPKLIIGFSDITVFHNHIHTHFGLPTLHATVPLNFKSNTPKALYSLINALNDNPMIYDFPASKFNRLGEVNAPLIGGNLSVLHSLIGTNSDIETSGKILFIEDIAEAIYAIDRMMFALKKSGKLEKLAGLIIGSMTNVKDSEIPFGKSVYEIISELVKPYSFPVCFDFPAGHIDDNRAMIFGKNASLKVLKDKVIFEQ